MLNTEVLFPGPLKFFYFFAPVKILAPTADELRKNSAIQNLLNRLLFFYTNRLMDRKRMFNRFRATKKS